MLVSQSSTRDLLAGRVQAANNALARRRSAAREPDISVDCSELGAGGAQAGCSLRRPTGGAREQAGESRARPNSFWRPDPYGETLLTRSSQLSPDQAVTRYANGGENESAAEPPAPQRFTGPPTCQSTFHHLSTGLASRPNEPPGRLRGMSALSGRCTSRKRGNEIDTESTFRSPTGASGPRRPDRVISRCDGRQSSCSQAGSARLPEPS